MIKAIIFDCFGVLASDGWLPFRERYFGNTPRLLEQAISFNKAVDAGISTYDEFISQIATLAGISREQVRDEIENNIPDETLFAYISQDLKPHYKIGMLSNVADDWLDEIFTREQVQLFDAIALSYEIGSIKPELASYKTIAARLGVDASECIFIDDQPKYCEGAVEAGMQAIHYTSLPQLTHALTRILR